jgi:6-phosphogluconolactonase
MSVHRHTHAGGSAAAEACARSILARLETATAGGGTATLAISGGTSPVPMFRALAAHGFHWTRVHLFWVDERAVPATDPQSNFRLAEENFIVPARFPSRNVHRIETEHRPEEAARLYSEDIRLFFGVESPDLPHFDVIHRGIGVDAHTASLFPGERLIADREGIAAAAFVEKLAQWRITLLPGVLRAARNTVVLATGADKAEAVRDVFKEPYDPVRYPAQLGLLDGHDMAWFLDEPAARLMD